MSAENRLRRKRDPEKRRRRAVAFLLSLVIMVGVAVAGYFAYGTLYGDGASENFDVVADGDRRIIRVPPGASLQSAINRAVGGDIIELQAGATYTEITLPKKSLTDFITIRSAAAEQLPAGVRVSPQQAALMARITTRGGGKSAVATENGAHHFRFVGIEFVPSGKDYVYNLVFLGATSNLVGDVPSNLEFDRCIFRSTSANVTRRGVAVNSADTLIANSFFEGFAYPQEETQAICGWTGTRNVRIINNYIEGGAENVMFGGSDPAGVELIPQDIEVRGNQFNKPESWRGKNSMKCLFEIKNAKRLQFTDNYLENNWLGSAFRITVRNQEGSAPFSTIEDIVIKNNVIRGSGEGINILGRDDTYPSQTLRNLSVSNNLFLDIGGQGYEGGGYFVQIAGGENILIANNTVFNNGNIVTFYGDVPRNFLFRDNVVGHGNYGVHGLSDIRSSEARRMFVNNVIVNNRRVGAGDTSFPTGNFFVEDASAVGFVSHTAGNFALAPGSRFKGKGSNRSDIGCDTKSLPVRKTK